MSRLRFAIEAWEPEFGTPIETSATGELSASEAAVDPSVEIDPTSWEPLRPVATPRRALRFIDGVRRVEARGWISTDGGGTEPGIFASYAAGILEAGARARLGKSEVRRTLFSPSGGEGIDTRVGAFGHVASIEDEPVVVLQRSLRELETNLAASSAPDGALTVVDGPLTPHHPPGTTLGYVKTHRVRYLPEPLDAVAAALEPGQRTPLFRTTTSWSRYSCYLRLPGPRTHAWAGIVRLEASAENDVSRARALADEAAVTLPRYASTPLKEPRAPQNLFPIAGLERELRRRLGNATVVNRALLRAAAGG